MKKPFFSLLLVIFFSAAGFTDQKIQIAVMDLSSKDIPAATVSTVSDFLRNDLFNTGKYVVLERTNLEKILKEQSLQKTGCTETDCAVEIGRILNMQQMVVGSMGKLGYKYFMNVRMIDVESAKMVSSVSESCSSENELPDLCKYIAKKLAGIPVERENYSARTSNFQDSVPRKISVKTADEMAWRSAILPGWGQIENGQDFKGYAIAGTEIIAIGATVLTYINHDQAVKDYQAAGLGADFTALAKKEEDTRNLNSLSFWIAVGIWAYGVADPYIFGPSKPGFSMNYENNQIQVAYRLEF